MDKQNINMTNPSNNIIKPKNRITTIIGLVVCTILVAHSIGVEIMLLRDKKLRLMGIAHGWDGSGIAYLVLVFPELVIAAIISAFFRKKSLGTARAIFNILRPWIILVGGLVIPLIGYIWLNLCYK